MNIASYIDHTLLKPATTPSEIKKLCEEAIEYGFAAVCIPPPLVKNARKNLEGSTVKVSTVIGFPFGYSFALAKTAETKQAIADGADELDVVINLVALKNNAWNYLKSEMAAITEMAHENNRLIKVIIESGILTNDEIIRCCELYAEAGVDFLKTSTGYAEKGASIEAVQLMRQHLPASIKVKASGGIRTYDFARDLVLAGAERLGCSASVAIVKGAGEANSTGY